ncbi:hypothetical protein BUALT_Bualt19G0068500 [Buddleja alternifolia]|uniref:Uncharacterized protein n=1 Tax=Buddleja alternifolia TaxID=168488 RepID=A0AAV6WA88_9LAMI|nr:hypothetical protein BUALT_Bualt19G0068500 [Buddleja alternifolia]
MKQNVDALNIIQLGLILSDAHGNLPHFNTGFQYIWQFNFSDFDSDRDIHNPESISLLKRQGIDFLRNKQFGIDSRHFAMLFNILTGKELPDDLEGFLMLVKLYFGVAVYDLKNMIRAFGLHGGLDRVAKSLNLGRVAGKSHQVG